MERGRGSSSSSRGISRGMLPLLAVHAVSEYCRLDRKPPLTAALVAANTFVYLRPAFLDRTLPSIDEVWFNPHLILKDHFLMFGDSIVEISVMPSSSMDGIFISLSEYQ